MSQVVTPCAKIAAYSCETTIITSDNSSTGVLIDSCYINDGPGLVGIPVTEIM